MKRFISVLLPLKKRKDALWLSLEAEKQGKHYDWAVADLCLYFQGSYRSIDFDDWDYYISQIDGLKAKDLHNTVKDSFISNVLEYDYR